ncbi:Uncharacterised protein [Chromobacterium violaceum]|uniref:Solute-binding protein family 3/N-terminal domain-containing protein n=1 Tax=Chromobacterium violaceum TaxID=536 RepID=A0A3S4HH74_CHRVL|nr:Uncharacterised protein [Chromobacterium violaceum]
MRARLIALLLALASPIIRAEAPPPDLLALTETLPPLSYEEDGARKGFANELLQMMLRDSGLRAAVEIKPWSRALREAQQTPNTLLYLTVRTPEREAWFKWVGPALPLPIELFRLSGPTPSPSLRWKTSAGPGWRWRGTRRDRRCWKTWACPTGTRWC